MTAPAANPTPIEALWTVPQVMAFLNFKRTRVYEMVHRGELPHVWLGSALRFEPEVIREWVKKSRNGAAIATVLPISGGRR